jgi:biopolymer transport protein ExbD
MGGTMLKRQRKRVLAKGDINVTPFIDILLVLLVIFMTITPVAPKGFRTNVPQAAPPNPDQTQPVETIVISLDRDGGLHINQKEVELPALPDELHQIFKTRNDKTVFVQADSDLLFAQIAQIIDAAKSSGVEGVGLMTDQIR